MLAHFWARPAPSSAPPVGSGSHPRLSLGVNGAPPVEMESDDELKRALSEDLVRISSSKAEEPLRPIAALYKKYER